MIADIKKTAEQKMGKSVETLKTDLTKVRTGRAHTFLYSCRRVSLSEGAIRRSCSSNVHSGTLLAGNCAPWSCRGDSIWENEHG